jgi:hypothetical protein
MTLYLFSILAALAMPTGSDKTYKPPLAFSLFQSPEQDAAFKRLEKTKEYVASRAHGDSFTMRQYQLLEEALKQACCKEKSLKLQDIELICTAIEFATEKHKGQTRKNKAKTPYISHLFGVTYYVVKIGQVRDPQAIQAALLHDVVEDTGVTLEEVQGQFGASVAGYVAELTDDPSLPALESKHRQVALAPKTSLEATQIKLADSLYNLRDLSGHVPEGWSQERVDAYFEWTQAKVDRLPSVHGELHAAVKTEIDKHWMR